MNLYEQIKAYHPVNPQEEADQKLLLSMMETQKDLFIRETLDAHFTASAWVVNADRSKVLMAYHNLYDSWAWLGGHADGQQDLLAVALKEAKEESGAEHIRPVTEEIFSLEILPVYGHEKKGKYVPTHLHLNLTYLLEANESDDLQEKPDENSAVAWIPVELIPERSTEPWFVERIYSKLCDKVRNMK